MRPILSLLAACSLVGCNDDLVDCPAADASVAVVFTMSVVESGGDGGSSYVGTCTVSSVSSERIALDCGAAGVQTVTVNSEPAPRLSAFTPGLAVRVEYLEQVASPRFKDLRISSTQPGGGLLFYATQGGDSLRSMDFAPLQFTDEASCAPIDRDRGCGIETARYSWDASVGGSAPVRAYDGSFVEVGEYQMWVPRAIAALEDMGHCPGSFPGDYTMAVLYAP